MAKKQASGQSAQTQLRVGRLLKAHGLKGGLKLELFTDDPDRRFQPGAEFSLQVPTSSPWHGKRIALAELRWYNGQPVGFFEGITDREGAESLVKAILWVDQSPDEPQEEDAWYDHQLVGLAVVRDGEPIGTIARVDHFPAQDLLVVSVGEREVLVPFVKAIVPSVDLARGVVTVTPPTGLFEDLPDDDDRQPDGAADAAAAGDLAPSDAGATPDAAEPAAPAEDAEAGDTAANADVTATADEPSAQDADAPAARLAEPHPEGDAPDAAPGERAPAATDA